MIPSFESIIKSIEKLPAAEQESIRRWLEDKGAKNGEGQGSQHTLTARQSRSVGYTKTEKTTQGKWVALDSDRDCQWTDG